MDPCGVSSILRAGHSWRRKGRVSLLPGEASRSLVPGLRWTLGWKEGARTSLRCWVSNLSNPVGRLYPDSNLSWAPGLRLTQQQVHESLNAGPTHPRTDRPRCGAHTCVRPWASARARLEGLGVPRTLSPPLFLSLGFYNLPSFVLKIVSERCRHCSREGWGLLRARSRAELAAGLQTVSPAPPA